VENILDYKWNKLLRRAGLFLFVPFVDIVFVAGSMAMETAKENSDFDVLVGARSGRIFTARAFCILFFGLLGWRKKRTDNGDAAKDKFCFSHFVTPDKYSLSGPHNQYWDELYSSLVPIYGDIKDIERFYVANSTWMKEERKYQKDIRHLYSKPGFIKIFLEKILSGKPGDLFEKWVKNIQIKKIQKSLETEKQYKPRIIFNDLELEFHPDTKRIEEYIKKI